MDDAGKLGFGNRRQRFPRPGGSGKAKQHGEQQDGRAQTVHKLLIRHGPGNTRRRSRGSAGWTGRAKGSAAPEDSRTVRPASTVSFPVERPLKGKSVSGNAGNRDSINTNAFEKGGMDSALAGLGREKRSLQKGPPSPMPPCRFKRNGPYSFSGSASLRNHSRVVVPDVLQRHVSGEHGPQRRGLSGCEGRHVDVHGQENSHQPGAAEMREQADLQEPLRPRPAGGEHEDQPGQGEPKAAQNGDDRHELLPAL